MTKGNFKMVSELRSDFKNAAAKRIKLSPVLLALDTCLASIQKELWEDESRGKPYGDEKNTPYQRGLKTAYNLVLKECQKQKRMK